MVPASTVYTYTVSGLGSPTGMTFDGAITSQAVLTLTTTDTDIRAGEAVDIDIASDIDISDFVASDITVTGGTRGALTGSGMDWTLAVTAGSAGTMTVAIAEDAVSPGNTASSQDFTVTARATATITFDDASGESGGSTGVNIAFSESVTGLQLSELTASAGTLSNLTGSGTSWEAALAFPATGSGTVTVSLAQDSTSPQNASASASISYAEDLVATTLDRISGNSQTAVVSTALSNPFVVEVQDQNGDALSGVTVTFAVTGGGGTLSATSVTTGATGRAESTLTLGSTAGTNTVTATVSGITAITFTATGTAAADPLTLSWTVPTAPVGNTFSATLNSNYPITGVELNDFRFRIEDNSEGRIDLTTANTTLAEVSGTNNWQLDITLTGTLDADYTMRLRGSTVQYDGSNYPPVFLVSDAFSIDSSIGADTVPGAPTSLTATAQANGTAMLLDWDAPNNDGGAAISDYDVSSNDGTTWTSIGSTNTTHTVTGLDKGTEYTFRVRAVNSVGDGTASAAVTETTDTTVPGAPTSLSVTTTQTTASLSWTAPTDTGGTPITEYQYRYQEGSTAGGTWTDTNSTATSVTISSLTAGTEYTFQVRTVNSTGNSAASSAVTESTNAETLVATTVVRISGNNQTDTVSTALDNPFVVEVRDQNGDALSGITVAFAVTAGGGSLSASSVTTNASGRASSTLTLGSTAGTNTVTATATGITTPVTFTATAEAAALVATSIVRISGNNQSGTVSSELSNPLVVEVRDQNGDGLSGVTVAFAVTAGGGTLSTTSVSTGSNGRAQSTLTLGSSAGTNTVTADVSGISTTITFTATAEALVATTVVRISGNNQSSVVSTALSSPFIVEVRDQNGDGLSGITVAFAVTAGGGSLSSASVTTGSTGRASSTLTLGSQ